MRIYTIIYLIIKNYLVLLNFQLTDKSYYEFNYNKTYREY